MAFEAANHAQVLTCDNYERLAWSDFITNQISPFANVPFYLGIGNHEVIPPKDKDEDAVQAPVLRLARTCPCFRTSVRRNKEPPQPEPYYH